MKDKEPKKVKTYKVQEAFYKKAIRRAEKEGGAIARLMESVLIAYSYGLDIKAVKTFSGGGQAIDLFTQDGSMSIVDFCKTGNKKTA